MVLTARTHLKSPEDNPLVYWFFIWRMLTAAMRRMLTILLVVASLLNDLNDKGCPNLS